MGEGLRLSRTGLQLWGRTDEEDGEDEGQRPRPAPTTTLLPASVRCPMLQVANTTGPTPWAPSPRSCCPHPIFAPAGGCCEFTCIWGGSLSPGQNGTEERGLKHYWFTSWPDQKTPDRAPPLLHLVREVEEAAQQEGPRCAPIIVHCRWVLPTGCLGRAASLPPTLPRCLPPAPPVPSVQGLAGQAASLPPASAASSYGMREWWTSLRPRASSVRTGQPVCRGGGTA